MIIPDGDPMPTPEEAAAWRKQLMGDDPRVPTEITGLCAWDGVETTWMDPSFEVHLCSEQCAYKLNDEFPNV